MHESPFVEPKIPRYKKFERGAIEKVIENEFSTYEAASRRAHIFFADPEHNLALTPEEVTDFVIFSSHVLKRLINAISQRDSGSLVKLSIIKGGDSIDDVFPLLYHDVSHVVGVLATGRHLINDNNVVPPFFEFKKGFSVNNQEVFENELYGVLFHTIKINGTDKNLTRETLSHSQILDEGVNQFIEAYIVNAMHAVLAANENEARQRELPSDFINEKAQEIAHSIQKNPPSELVKILTYVWDNQENDRVFIDLFFSIVRPYLDRIKLRETYKNFSIPTDLDPK